jgi:hypothetical protein
MALRLQHAEAAMINKPWTFFGVPIFGVILPFVGRRRLPLNRDGSFVDTGAPLIENETGWYYVEPFVIEWLGFGRPFGATPLRLSSTGEIVNDHDFESVGGEPR